jgi:hypothetical protein
MKFVYLIFCSTLEYHTLLHYMVMPSLIFTHLSSEMSLLGMLGMRIYVAIQDS